ncbi:putative Allophanate hydrolase subunit 1 [Vibrio nigripulchritudo MADA3029]|uniref:Allophanate hydrolase subunit 1 n=1 Tax=Vibrio nigripulchritudo SOn1 TaxID=1238450 RepID=A0AAV2VMS6_9VIBR|nr:allophanate hydrolase subunit 1 [Vibrio nigripulchritudo]CCN50110.1 putative Allophanate hydrolase subunit 1 [Vibrio nigripulchritudo MADA3020]CCN54388.1 putative Allophanate hydrolase subunit 1 [Vibrio nigripulchritudo MADA3021]CCN58987.1 putative Allophanate hydrolase subunit 1 [Vibrio nigripulchritudo MADA3029]CCO45754.1 putative Allophanate hydrolase subunit 1 [Vibrio nigripulchritudo SOn1]
MIKFEIQPVAECSLIVYFGSRIDPKLAPFIGEAAKCIAGRFSDQVMNVTPSYTSILIDYLPFRIHQEQFITQLRSLLNEQSQAFTIESKSTLHKLPVYYGGDTGPDLKAVAEFAAMTSDNVIKLHTESSFRVCAIGFSPGFAFLAEVPNEIAKPRHDTPRVFVPSGSVGIASNQTAVYPSRSPGGWNIIGNCPTPLWDSKNPDSTPGINIGDVVQFYSITEKEFVSLGGEQWV